jgi:hypothetical protein
MNALKAGLVATLVAGSIGTVVCTTGCEGTSQVRDIFMALDGQGFRPRNTFYTDTTVIYCDVTFSAASNDETVDVQFVQNTGESTLYDGSDSRNQVKRLWVANEAAPTAGLSTVSFTFDQPQLTGGGGPAPYAVGDYECDITVNGAPAGSVPFTVQYPGPAGQPGKDCPAGGGANSTLSCMGYRAHDQCPSDENFALPTACTCPSASDVGGDPTLRMWQCQ